MASGASATGLLSIWCQCTHEVLAHPIQAKPWWHSPYASQMPPRHFPDASQLPPRCLRMPPDVSHMPPKCPPDASQLTSARRHKSYHRIPSNFYWNFIGNKNQQNGNFLSHETCIYRCKNQQKWNFLSHIGCQKIIKFWIFIANKNPIKIQFTCVLHVFQEFYCQ